MEMEFTWDRVSIDCIRLEINKSDDPLCYNEKLYLLKKTEIFSDQAIPLLLNLHPIFVVRRRHLYWVVAGARTFVAAAHTLNPKKEIPIAILKRPTDEQLQNLKYYDLAVMPLLLSFAGSAADIYTHCNSAQPNQQSLPLLNSSLRSFAAALGRSASALCLPKGKSSVKPNLNAAAEADK